MSDRKGVSNIDRFPKRKDDRGRNLCRICGAPLKGGRTFCGPRCLRDFFMRTDWKRVRKVVFARDGGVCMKCGNRVKAGDFHVDHIVPVAGGGDEWDLANLELSCAACNLSKGVKVEIEYVVLESAQPASNPQGKAGRRLCPVCGGPVWGREIFCGPRCRRDHVMRTDPKRVGKVVRARDGGVCMRCGRHVRAEDSRIGHVVPVSRGGDAWDLSNLELSCPACVLAKPTHADVEYVVLKRRDGLG